MEPMLGRERILDGVYSRLKEAILSGKLRPGSRLSIPELARQLQVSRSPVREAVRQLVSDGLAIDRPRQSPVVPLVEAADLLEIHQVRESLEGQAAGLAAVAIDSAGLERLETILLEQEQMVTTKDGSGFSRTDFEFHTLIAEYCGNKRLERFVVSLKSEMRLALLLVARSQEHTERAFEEHWAIFHALKSHDAALAEQAMREHIQNTRKTLTTRIADPNQKGSKQTSGKNRGRSI